jgi:hypothetical protein
MKTPSHHPAASNEPKDGGGKEDRPHPSPMNPKMVERTPHPGPLPIGSADSADAERGKRSQRLVDVQSRVVQGVNARIFRGILLPQEKEIVVPAPGEFGSSGFALVQRLPSNPSVLELK